METRVETSTTEDEDFSEDNERSEGRRRRLCIERKQDINTPDNNPIRPQKRPRFEGSYHGKPQHNHLNPRRKPAQLQTRRRRSHLISVALEKQATYNKTSNSLDREQLASTSTETTSKQTKTNTTTASKVNSSEPVIYVNPKLIRKFVDKSIELSSGRSQQQNVTCKGGKKRNMIDLVAAQKPLDINTVPIQSLQAASAMVAIRLATECIQNNLKRDERLNKIIAARLVEAIKQRQSIEVSDAM